MDHQLRQIIDAVDADLDLVTLMGRRCEAQAARAGSGYDRLGIIPFTIGAELRLAKAGRVLARIGGQDLLARVVDKIVDRNGGDRQRRQILRRVWNLDVVQEKRAS
jgi:hypothetical protein